MKITIIDNNTTDVYHIDQNDNRLSYSAKIKVDTTINGDLYVTIFKKVEE